MADLKISVYGSIATVLDTQLNALANGSVTAASSAIDNGTDLYTHDDLELFINTFASAPTANSPIYVYMLPTVDGTNFADGSATISPQPTLLVATFLVRADNSNPQRLVCRGVPLPPDEFKYILRNSSGQALPASSNTLKRRPYRYTVN